jgi:opacity protein-like surface antigen
MSNLHARAEMYVAGQAGVTLPQSLSNIDVTGSGIAAGTKSSNLDLKTSFMYGAKLGYYFDSLKWLGVETEVFNTTPHVKEQAATCTGPGCAGLVSSPTGSYLRVLTWAPINFVARYQIGQLEPYAGVGLGLFFARTKDGQTGESSSSTQPGLNAQAGLRYLITKNIAIFGEWKFNHARFKFDETPSFAGMNATYNVHHLVFGAGYHF